MRITFLGDIMVTPKQLELARYNDKYNFMETLSRMREPLSHSDYVVANLETTIAGDKLCYTNGKYSFNTPKELLEAIEFCGIDCLATANNHCLDRGIEGIIHTFNNLQNMGIACIGTHIKPEKAYRIIDLDGIKIGLLAFTYGTNAFDNKVYLSDNQKYMVDLFQEQELSNPFLRKLYDGGLVSRIIMKIFKTVRLGQFSVPVYERREQPGLFWKRYINSINECRKDGADFIVSYLHVGGQFNEEPTHLTKGICDYSLNHGVDAVIANHEHVIHGIKTDIDTGKFCIYSLGNFLTSYGVVDDPFDIMCEYSVAVNIDFENNNNIPEYSFWFIHSFQESGKILCAPLYDSYISADLNRKKYFMEINNRLVNIVMGTNEIQYPIVREYKIKELS